MCTQKMISTMGFKGVKKLCVSYHSVAGEVFEVFEVQSENFRKIDEFFFLENVENLYFGVGICSE